MNMLGKSSFSPGSPLSRTFFQMEMTGRICDSAGVSLKIMRILGSYALVYLTSGSGRYQLAGQRPRACRAGDILIIFPELPHGYGPGPGEHWNEIYLVFKGAVMDLWRECGLLSPANPVLRLTPVDRTVHDLEAIVAAKGGRGPAGNLRQACLLQSLLARALAAQAKQAATSARGVVWPGWVEAAVARMEEEPALSLEEIAQAGGLAYESFRKKFRAVTGSSPAAFRARVAMNLACKWMYEERLSNREIAERLGYCDEFHFCRRFKQITGRTTGEFRRSLLAPS